MLATDYCLTETRQARLPNTMKGKEIPFIQNNSNIFIPAITCHLAQCRTTLCHFQVNT